MTSPVILPARLAYLVEKEPGRVLLTLRSETGEETAILTKGQLSNIVSDGAKFMRNMMEVRHVG